MTVPTSAPFRPLELPCGVVLKHRIVKSAMSDSLGDGCGDPTPAQIRLYERWAEGGVAASIVGEVQGDARYAEKPGNLVLDGESDAAAFRALAARGSANGTALWLQLGHAGALTHPPIGEPRGPSALDLPGLRCAALELDEIRALPGAFARTAARAEALGFGGVQVHAAHGFLLSQFLSPLFNRRRDAYGGSAAARRRLLLEVVDAVRAAVGRSFVVAVKLNATDGLAGGVEEADALDTIAALDATGIDLVDISGGTYFPGAAASSDRASPGPHFVDFARRARGRTDKPLMVTGGFKTRRQVESALAPHGPDLVGLARALVLDPALPDAWRAGAAGGADFPRFDAPAEGAVTAWYTMRMTALGAGAEPSGSPDAARALRDYEARDASRVQRWNLRHR